MAVPLEISPCRSLKFTFGATAVQTLKESATIIAFVQGDDESRAIANELKEVLKECGIFADIRGELIDAALTCRCVVFVSPNYKEAVAWNKICRKKKIGFIWGCHVAGLVSLFCDPGQDVIRINPEGFCRWDSQPVMVGNVTKDSLLHNVTCVTPHGLSSGDIIALCGQLYRAEVISPLEFQALEVDPYQADALASWSIEAPVKESEVHLIGRRGSELFEEKQHYTELCHSVLYPCFDQSGLDHHELMKNHFSFLTESKVDCGDLAEKLHVEIDYAKLERKSSKCSSNPPGKRLLCGLVAGQVLNLITLRFRPLRQWLHVDLGTEESAEPTSGKDADDGFQPLAILLNGPGSIGLKALDQLLTRPGLVSKVYVAAPEEMRLGGELSGDVGRQLLERQIEQMKTHHNSDIEVIIMPENSPENEEHYFGEKLFSQIDAIITCSGSWEVRRHISNQSVHYGKALIDVGTDNLIGHLQTVIPHVTESYTCSNDPTDPEYPFCVIKSFPYTPNQVIEWSKNKASNFFRVKPLIYNEFLENENLVQRIEAEEALENSAMVSKYIPNLCSTWEDCVALARRKFEKYFNHKARHLLANFPEDAKGSSNMPFWSYPKLVPNPIAFDDSNELHISFLQEMASLIAKINGVQLKPTDTTFTKIKQILASVKVDGFVSRHKTIITDENVSKSDVETETSNSTIDFRDFASKLKLSSAKRLNVISEPDLEPLIILLTRLRCSMYSIACPDNDDIIRIASQTCPCPPPVVNILSDLILLELESYYLRHKNDPQNWWISLASTPIVLLRSSSQPVKPLEKGMPFTLWDKLEVHGEPNWTLEDFLNTLENKFRLKANMVVQGTKMIYVEAMPTHKSRKGKLMSSLVRRDDPACPFVLLNITASGHGDDLSAPPVKYYFTNH